MDAAWIRRQFVFNGLIGRQSSVDRVVALVLLINEAFVENGYINTGLRFAERDWPSANGQLDLWLTLGSTTPRRLGSPRIEVHWKQHLESAANAQGASRRRRNPATRILAVVQDLGHQKGSGGLSPNYVRDRIASANRSPLNMIAVEREFRRLSDDDALRTVNADLRPGDQPGEARLSLTVAPQPRLDVYTMVASSRTPSIGGIRYSGGASIRNLLFSGDVVTIDGGETSGLADGSLDYSTPLFRPSTRLDLRGSIDQAAVLDQAVLALGIRSSDTTFEASLIQRFLDVPLTPLPGGKGWQAAQRLEVALRFTSRHSQSTLDGTPFSFSPGSVNGVTDLNVIRGEVSFVRRTENSVLAVSADGSVGLSGTGSDLPGVVRPDANFTTVLGQASYLLRLPRLLSGGVEFKAALAGQLSGGPLYVSEQFSAGGDTVRGYRQNDLLADEGVRGTLELYCPVGFGHGLCDAHATDWKSIKLSVFADGAYMHNHRGAQPMPSSIGSLGVAVAWSPTRSSTVEISYGPLKIPEHRTGPIDFQDRGLQFSVTVHPLAPFQPD